MDFAYPRVSQYGPNPSFTPSIFSLLLFMCFKSFQQTTTLEHFRLLWPRRRFAWAYTWRPPLHQSNFPDDNINRGYLTLAITPNNNPIWMFLIRQLSWVPLFKALSWGHGNLRSYGHTSWKSLESSPLNRQMERAEDSVWGGLTGQNWKWHTLPSPTFYWPKRSHMAVPKCKGG